MSAPTALDTSVAVALLATTHPGHRATVRWAADRTLAFSGHALAETYSVLTRLPDGARGAPADVARLLTEGFAPPLLLGTRTAAELPAVLARVGIVGGAVYDAMVGLAAAEHDAVLATRDARAKATYDAVGARVAVVA